MGIPEEAIHVLLPFMLLLALRFEPLKALAYSMFGVVPDLDVLFGTHRSYTHSFVIVGAVLLPLLLAAKVKGRAITPILVVTLVVFSHIFMDVFTGYTPVLYPLYDREVYIKYDLTVNTTTYALKSDLKVMTEPVHFELKPVDAPILTENGLVLIPFVLILMWWRR